MKHARTNRFRRLLLLALVCCAGQAQAEAAVAAAGTAVDWQPLSDDALQTLVGPVALYPDDLLAIVLPAATFPLQIVQAARLLEARQEDPATDLTADADWDESVVALLNYPEVLARLNDDLDWTQKLGQAALHQQGALLAAADRFRRAAYAAGNLPSDARQTVSYGRDCVTITPTDPARLYVPRYAADLIHRRNAAWYGYYPRPYPVYYYPYPPGHTLIGSNFWGVTSVFSIGWGTRHLHLHSLRHRSHPYYGSVYYHRHYRYWYPRLAPSRYYRDHPAVRHHAGNRWTRQWRGHYSAALPERHAVQADGGRSWSTRRREPRPEWRGNVSQPRTHAPGSADSAAQRVQRPARQIHTPRAATLQRPGRSVPQQRTTAVREAMSAPAARQPSAASERGPAARGAPLRGSARGNAPGPRGEWR